MSSPRIIPLDLYFQGVPGVIASYLLPHNHGAALIESGPGSTSDTLTRRLLEQGYTPADISDVFITHIHLDHAGAAGWLARQGARIHVHPAGAPHLADPGKLLASATRIYGDQMDTLWGEFLAVPADKLSVLQDGERANLPGLSVLAVESPGHANHHMVYLYEGVCFTGDVGGVRLSGMQALRVPMPPPEFHLESWRETIKKIIALKPQAIAPTHFGIHEDPAWHLSTLENYLDQIENWMITHFTHGNSPESIRAEFNFLTKGWDENDGLQGWSAQAYELANPIHMSLDGMLRYWRKYREVQN